MTTFQKATRQRRKLKMAIIGPTGSGKTFSALKIARGIVGPEGRIAVLDTEHGSASIYSDQTEFDVLELESCSPQNYIDGIDAAVTDGYDILIIDSLSHAWAGKDGVLQFKDEVAKRERNDFTAWRTAGDLQNKLVDKMVSAKIHMIVTLRSKMKHEIITDDNGKKRVEKLGLQPVQRDGLEYEFDIVADMDQEHTFVVSKSRCFPLADKVVRKPNGEVSKILSEWVAGGEVRPPKEKPAASGNGNTDDARWDDVKAVMQKLDIPKQDAMKYIRNQFDKPPNELTINEIARVPAMLWEEWGGSISEPDPQGEPEPETPADNPGPETAVSADPDPGDDGALF